MNNYLTEILNSRKIEKNSAGETVELHSNTSMAQCLFIEDVFDKIKPKKSLEVGLAMGISAMCLLDKHKEAGNSEKCHIIIEPYNWENIAEHNIEKTGLLKYADIRYKKSDFVLTELFHTGHRIQLAYVDTTKVMDIVMQDFYFIDKILDVNGVIILDDCGGSWPGVQKVARFINTLPHYQVFALHQKSKQSLKSAIAEKLFTSLVSLVPFKKRFLKGFSMKTDKQLGLDYACIVFKKIENDTRNWDWDAPL